MKKAILTLLLVGTTMMNQAQENKLTPISQVTVSGEGKIKVIPDEAVITVGVEYTGSDAKEVKKKNDETVDLVLKTIKPNKFLCIRIMIIKPKRTIMLLAKRLKFI